MKELTSIQKLDETLKLLSEYNYGRLDGGEIFSKLKKKFPSLENQNDFGTELNRILYKLVKDNNFYSTEKILGGEEIGKYYHITVEGKMFSNEGGYAQDIKNRGLKNSRILRNEW